MMRLARLSGGWQEDFLAGWDLTLQNQSDGSILQGVKRTCEALMREYLGMFPCVAVVGVRQCGKTTMVRRLPEDWRHFDMERQADYDLVARDVDGFFRLYPERVAIDEAQLVPELFAALRVAIDERRSEPGRFVVTGSSSPDLLSSISESLAGRVGVIELSPFSWDEVTGTSGRDSFLRRLAADRKASARDLIEGLEERGDVGLAHDFWFRGGFPEPWLRHGGKSRRRWVDQYLQSYLYRDVKRLFPGLNDLRFRRFVEMLGGLSGRVLNYAEVARSLNVSQPTARDYFEIAHGTFLWRNIPAYSRNVVKRVVKHPRGYLRDSGLSHALQRIPDLEALLSHPSMGRSWEGMVVEEILRQYHAIGEPIQAAHYRTGGGAEVDLVLEGDFGLVAVEIKHASSVSGRDLRSLTGFVREYGARLGVVIDNGREPRMLGEQLVSLPFTRL
jgi:predicted AAA+ superfamily ATPase